MAIQRKRYDRESAMPEAVAYLLRKQQQLDNAGGRGDGVGDDYVFQGPIEVTYLVAAANARPELRALADFVCSGANDDVEINIALEECIGNGGRVILSEGTFVMNTNLANVVITVPSNVALIGVGRGVTILQYADSHLFDFTILYNFESEIGHFSIKQEIGT